MKIGDYLFYAFIFYKQCKKIVKEQENLFVKNTTRKKKQAFFLGLAKLRTSCRISMLCNPVVFVIKSVWNYIKNVWRWKQCNYKVSDRINRLK